MFVRSRAVASFRRARNGSGTRNVTGTVGLFGIASFKELCLKTLLQRNFIWAEWLTSLHV